MDHALLNTIVSTGGAVIVGLGGMWISTNQIGKRIDDIGRRLDRLEDQLNAFKDVVNSKFSALDLEISKLLDRSK